MSQLKRRKENNDFEIVGDHSFPIRYLPSDTIDVDDYVVFDKGTGAKKTTVEGLLNSGSLSNRNLLDNPWFTVNQRGYTDYIGGSGTDTSTTHYLGNSGYTVDRWKTTNANTSVRALTTEQGIKITNSTAGNAGYLLQILEDGDSLLGKTVTLSIKALTGVVRSVTGTILSEYPSSNTVICAVVDPANNYNIANVMMTTNAIWVRVFSNANENERYFKAVKLELGSVSTLANDVAPNYAEELLKCQRYFVRKYVQYVFSGRTATGGKYVCPSEFTVPLRTIPSYQINSMSGVSNQLSDIDGNDTTIYEAMSGGLITPPALRLAATEDVVYSGYLCASADL